MAPPPPPLRKTNVKRKGASISEIPLPKRSYRKPMEDHKALHDVVNEKLSGGDCDYQMDPSDADYERSIEATRPLKLSEISSNFHQTKCVPQDRGHNDEETKTNTKQDLATNQESIDNQKSNQSTSVPHSVQMQEITNAEEKAENEMFQRIFEQRKYMTLKEITKEINLSKSRVRKALKRIGKLKPSKWCITSDYIKAFHADANGSQEPNFTDTYRQIIRSFIGCKFQRLSEMCEKTNLPEKEILKALRIIDFRVHLELNSKFCGRQT
ncbi:uncharacterized protein [Drosophila tropicalis]|uniref:uncharacterized protein n=1 Tax=Drosophila tropicalis TaxID=46794 RepID=UPI0035AC1391